MKNIVFAGLFLLFAGAASADPRDDALVAVLRCSGMSDTVQRLACYDSVAVRVPGALSAPVAPAASAAPAAAPAAVTPAPRKSKSSFFSRMLGLDNRRPPQTTAEQFGSESIANGGASAIPFGVAGDTVNQISARLTEYEFANGYVTVSLDNGQVWRQASSDQPLGHLSKPARAYVAVIRRGRSGDSYAMTLGNLAGTISVRRIR